MKILSKNPSNQGILEIIVRKLFMKGCGTPVVEEILAIGREKYLAKKKSELIDIFNQLDKSTLPTDKLNELEELINKRYSLTERSAEEVENERKKGREIFKELLYQNEEMPY